MEEIWKTIYDKYEISNFGNLRSLKTRKKIAFEKCEKGYLITKIIIDGKRKRIGVHRLVAIAFIPNPNNYPQVNHKDENKENNKVDNLEWCTAKYNNNYGNRRKNLSKNLSGKNNPFYGKHHSEESKNKMRKKHNLSEEQRKKMSDFSSEHFKNLIWINNGKENKRVAKEISKEYLEKGWNLGRTKNEKISLSLKKYFENNPEKRMWGRNKNEK